MRAQLLLQHGGPEHFSLAQVPKPIITQGSVLIRIHAASVNPVDIKIRDGLPIAPPLPAILGADLAGIVEEVGPGVTRLRPGDAVYACAGGVRGLGGSLAEFIVADADLVALKPASLSMRQAAALPLVSITAWQALDKASLSLGQSILIFGGTGGVGHVAVQLAKLRGARVTATVGSAQAAQHARALGADHVINYRQDDVPAKVAELTQGQGFDVVFDTVGGTNLPNAFAAAAKHGRVVTINARTQADLSPLHAKALSLHVVFMLLPLLDGQGRAAHGAILEQVASLADQGKLRPLLDPLRFTLETAPDAHRHLASGQAMGKVVIDMV